jgi:prepilin-type N-terminal cleavage/methylation domain-containing protein
MKEQGTKWQRHKGEIKNSVPLCLCAPVPGKKGFTLLELSLVILVIGLVLALVLPNLGTPKAKLEKEREIERLSQTIKYLYNLSQVQNEKIYLLFDLNGNKFWAMSLPAEEDGERINQLAAPPVSQTGDYLIPEKRLRSSLKVKDIINSKGSKITEGIVPLIFHPSGFVEPATIHFVDEKETFYTLFINPLTGQSRVELGYLEEE